jgi:hypothetical protein
MKWDTVLRLYAGINHKNRREKEGTHHESKG